MARKLTDTVRINLRFSEALRRELERLAARNNRSINDEIVTRVIKSLAREETMLKVVETIAETHIGVFKGKPVVSELIAPTPSGPAPKLTEEEEKLFRELQDRVQQSQKKDPTS
jgi:DNA replication initiation complex subunit (GINS family)